MYLVSDERIALVIDPLIHDPDLPMGGYDPSEPTPGIRVADVSWPVVEGRLSRGAVAVLPIGAASKEHGRHLPMATDLVQVEWLVDRLVQQANVVVWPAVSYGYYPAFVDYPGSTSLSEKTFTALVIEILGAIRHAGAQRVLLLNSGISTIGPLEVAIGRSPGFAILQLVNVYAGPHYRACEAELVEQPRGGHADEPETSIMLAIAPEKVDMSQAGDCSGNMIRGHLQRTDPGTPGYSPSGVYGDPTLASAGKGRRLAEAMLADVLAELERNQAR
jgi:creatinine amidohydrolase